MSRPTDRRKFTAKIILFGISSFHFYRGNQFKVISWPVRAIQETSPNFLQSPTRVDNTADNTDITQSRLAGMSITIDY